MQFFCAIKAVWSNYKRKFKIVKPGKTHVENMIPSNRNVSSFIQGFLSMVDIL